MTVHGIENGFGLETGGFEGRACDVGFGCVMSYAD